MNKRSVPGTPNLLRLVNRNTILMLLEQMEATSRTELSSLTGLSLPTVSAVVKELLAEDWVQEVGGGISQGGKPPQLIKLNPDARYIGAIQMNEDKMSIRITNLGGQVCNEDVLHTGKGSARSLCNKAAKRLLELVIEQPLIRDAFLGVGVAVPGVVNEFGVVSNAPEFGWDNEPIHQYFSEALQFDVVVENDVRLAVMGEAWRRKTVSGTVVYVHLSKGIGAGILIDGRLYKGAHFAAGEIGNMIVDSDALKGTPADLLKGNQGMFEAQYGLNSLDSANQEKENWVLSHIAYGVVNTISLLDPETIVFGGEMTTRLDRFLERMTAYISPLVSTLPEMYVTPLGNDAPLFGATKIILENQKAQVTWTSI